MPRVLYCARTRPPLEPPFPLPPPPSTPTTASQQHIDLDDPNSPTSPLPPDPNHQQPYYDDSYNYKACPPPPDPNNQQRHYDYDSDDSSDYEECPPSPGPAEGYSCGDECFDPYLEGVTDFANIALEHYNSQQKNQIKYQLTKAIVSSVIRVDGSYYHSNFTAKTTLENSKEEFFFAELRLDCHTWAWVPVSIVVLEEDERVGGFSKLLCHGGVDPRHCFGCGDVVKHPVDGSLYEAGHFLVDNQNFDKYIEVLPTTQPSGVQNYSYSGFEDEDMQIRCFFSHELDWAKQRSEIHAVFQGCSLADMLRLGIDRKI